MGALPMAIAFYFRWNMHTETWEQQSRRTLTANRIQEVVMSDDMIDLMQNKNEVDINGNQNHGVFPTPTPVFERRPNSTEEPPKTWKEVPRWFFNIVYIERHKLLGTAGTWFILDVVFYANGLFSGQVSKSIGGINTPKGEAISTLI